MDKTLKLVSPDTERILRYGKLPMDNLQIMDSIATAVIITDLEGTIYNFNKAAEQMFELSRKDAIGTRYYYGLAPEEENRLQEVFYYVVNTKKTFCGQDLTFTTRKKEQIILNPHVSLISDKEGQGLGIIMVIEDVTEKRAMEKFLQRKDKLTAVGELAVGIAHELRNPLSSIKGFAAVIKTDLPTDNPNQQYLDIIIKEADRIIKSSQKLLNTAKNPEIEKYIPVQINDVVRKTVECFKVENTFMDSYVQMHLHHDLPMIWGEPDKLEQVMMNLLYNAYEALDTSGYIYVDTNLEKDWVKIRVSDTGSGIELEKIDRIFDLYYTTKLEGNGLGLAIVHSIITNHWGYIEVESKPDRGTLFVIRLPVREKVKILE